jgi:hypothetical protein
MTVGAVIFAHNNKTIDYTKLAVFAAKRIKQHLDIPVSLIIDNRGWLLHAYPDHPFDKVIDSEVESMPSQTKTFFDGSLSREKLEWKNFSRSQIYNLTPYETTLVIDSDYVINSSILKSAFDIDCDLQLYHNTLDLALNRDPTAFKRINQYSIPFYWATVFVFKKNPIMECFFNLIEYIKSNWFYFKTLYSIEAPAYRNDIAFSIAIHIMNGKTNGEFALELPGKMIFAADKDILVSADANKMQFLVEKKDYLGEYTMVKTTGLDVHVMNKFSLSRYIDGGYGV